MQLINYLEIRNILNVSFQFVSIYTHKNSPLKRDRAAAHFCVDGRNHIVNDIEVLTLVAKASTQLLSFVEVKVKRHLALTITCNDIAIQTSPPVLNPIPSSILYPIPTE